MQKRLDALEAAKAIHDDKKTLQSIIEVLEKEKTQNWSGIKQSLLQNEEEILRFIDQAQLEDQPTDVLV